MQHTCGARQAGTSDAREGEGECSDPARSVEPVEIRIRHPGLAVACRRSRPWFWRLGELADVLASRELSPSISSSWSTAVLVVRARWIFIDDLISCPRAQQAILGSSRCFALSILVLVGTSRRSCAVDLFAPHHRPQRSRAQPSEAADSPSPSRAQQHRSSARRSGGRHCHKSK